LVEFLKTDRPAGSRSLVDITAVDYPERPKRFDVVYHFLSMYQNHRIRLRVAVREDEMVPSITSVHPSANWFEREVFDMFGILFSGHPDLRRILTDYGFRGYPLRKDFPTTGYTEVRYDEAQKARGLRAREPGAGIPPVRFHEPVGRGRIHPARRRKAGGQVMGGIFWLIFAADHDPDAEALAAFRDQQVLGAGLRCAHRRA
jgi:NADH/F420H2 dehydrogenase subunit C